MPWSAVVVLPAGAGRRPVCVRTSASLTFGLYFIVQVPRPRWMSTSAPSVSCESRRKWRSTTGWESSGSAGRRRCGAGLGGSPRRRRRPARRCRRSVGGQREAALAGARLLVQERLVPAGLVERPQRRGAHRPSSAIAVASASASRSMSAFVCTSVTQTSAEEPSWPKCRERSSRPWMPAASSERLICAHRATGAGEVDDELLEERRRERGRAHARQLADPPRRVLAALHDRVAQLAQPVRPEQRQVDRDGDPPERLRGAGEVARLAALHVGHAIPAHLAEAPLIRRGARGADHERRVLADDLLVVGAGDEADGPPP